MILFAQAVGISDSAAFRRFFCQDAVFKRKCINVVVVAAIVVPDFQGRGAQPAFPGTDDFLGGRKAQAPRTFTFVLPVVTRLDPQRKATAWPTFAHSRTTASRIIRSVFMFYPFLAGPGRIPAKDTRICKDHKGTAGEFPACRTAASGPGERPLPGR